MRARLRTLLLVTLIALSGRQAFAWNNIGHMAVAYIAWQQLTPAEQTRVATLVKDNPLIDKWSAEIPTAITGSQRDMYLFMIAATWPDQIKGALKEYPCPGGNSDIVPPGEDISLNTGYGDKCIHGYWHFVDVSYDPDGIKPVPTPPVNAESKIDFFTQALETTESDDLKSYDLVWLEHLVGDIHQPLHCVTRFTAAAPKGDRGGNDVLITGSDKELHAYWDNILGDKTTSLYTDARLAETVANGLPTPKPTLARDSKPADWKQESVADAEAFAYAPPIGPGLTPGPGQKYDLASAPGYHTNALTIAQERVAIAGIRLANLIHATMP